MMEPGPLKGLLIGAPYASLAFLCAVPCTWLSLKFLRNKQILDHPNGRSSHTLPTPRGGGIGFVAVVLAFLIVSITVSPSVQGMALLAGVMLIAAISFADDMKPVALSIRLAAHVIAVTLVLATLPDTIRLVPGWMPMLVERAIIGFGWVWFINLFNFMDGIDGLAGSEAVAICVGIMVLAGFAPAFLGPAVHAAPIAGAVLAFLLFNWPPAKLFMGDIGSVTLGFLLGYVLILTALQGGLAAAILLPLYFCLDATVTLARRALRGAKLGEAHRDHAYQRAVVRGASHAKIVTIVTMLNLALIALAAWSLFQPLLAVAAGVVLTIACYLALLLRVGAPARSGASSQP